MRRSWICLAALGALTLVPSAAFGQEDATAELPQESSYMEPDAGWEDQRFYIGGFAGNMTGGTPLGSIENVFFRSSYVMDSNSMWGLRAGFTLSARFDFEVEYGRSSPAMNVILTNLAGQGKTEFLFADLQINYTMGVVNYSLLERSRRIVPLLSLGYGTVGVSSGAAEIDNSRQMGLVFGGGLRVRIVENLGLRADVRGLRTGFGPKQEEGQLPSVFYRGFVATNLYWSVGVEFRF